MQPGTMKLYPDNPSLESCVTKWRSPGSLIKWNLIFVFMKVILSTLELNTGHIAVWMTFFFTAGFLNLSTVKPWIAFTDLTQSHIWKCMNCFLTQTSACPCYSATMFKVSVMNSLIMNCWCVLLHSYFLCTTCTPYTLYNNNILIIIY